MRCLTVQPVCRNLTYLSGHGSRDLVTEVCNGRPPVWSNLGRAWCVQPSTAADVIALAELRRFRVMVLPQDDPLPAARGALF
jgi:hypothetical protein